MSKLDAKSLKLCYHQGEGRHVFEVDIEFELKPLFGALIKVEGA